LITFNDALELHLKERGFNADKHWKALLYLATSNEKLWDLIWPVIDFKEGFADLQKIDMDVLSSGERILIKLAKELYNRGDFVSVTDAIGVLDNDNWGIFQRAISVYRGNG
jgi:hypothetical protein